jgi:hypothetical protein
MDCDERNSGGGVRATLPDFTQLTESLPAIIPATQLSRLLGGLYTRKTLSNMRWLGRGPKAYRAAKGRKLFHTREDIISWLQAEMRPFDPDAAT